MEGPYFKSESPTDNGKLDRGNKTPIRFKLRNLLGLKPQRSLVALARIAVAEKHCLLAGRQEKILCCLQRSATSWKRKLGVIPSVERRAG